MLAQLVMLYYGSENVYQVWCGAFCETSFITFVHVNYKLSTPTLFARHLETVHDFIVFSV